MRKIRKHYIFNGQVQGVGFRYRAVKIAETLGLTGWVRNLWDGTVEMEVQGTGADIRQMISMLREQRFIVIDEICERTVPALKDENSFRIR